MHKLEDQKNYGNRTIEIKRLSFFTRASLFLTACLQIVMPEKRKKTDLKIVTEDDDCEIYWQFMQGFDRNN